MTNLTQQQQSMKSDLKVLYDDVIDNIAEMAKELKKESPSVSIGDCERLAVHCTEGLFMLFQSFLTEQFEKPSYQKHPIKIDPEKTIH